MDNHRSGLLSKTGSAYEYLRRLATEGRLRPGRRLSPNDLATELQVSGTPAREALARLAAEGFISGRDGRGYFTKAYTVDEQRDLAQLLFSQSMTALYAAGERGTVVAKAALERLDAAAREENSGPEAAEAFVDAFDALIAEFAAASGNRVLPVLLQSLLDRTRYLRRLDARDAVHRLAKATVMRTLVDSMTAGNLMGAVALVRNHLGQYAARLGPLVEEANRTAADLRFP